MKIRSLKFAVMMSLLLIPLMINSNPVTAAGENLATEIDGEYEIRIEASQWEFKAFDKNKADQDGVDLSLASEEGKEPYLIEHRIEFNKNTNVTFFLYSADVQHGFSVNELDIAVALNRATGGDAFGEVTSARAELPNEDVTYSAFCHIFCGLGHPDMKIKLVVGDGSPEIGKFVFWGAIILNVGIFGFAARSIYTKLDELPDE